MTVFVVNRTDDDISAAEKWGTVRYVNHRYINGDEITPDRRIPIEFEEHMAQAAKAFNIREDYLLICGDHLQLLAFASMLARDHAYYKVLRWDRREKAYFPVEIGT